MARFAVRPRVCRTRGALRMMTGRKFLSPPLLALAPQSDHGSAARAETVAFFQYGPPQSFFELTQLALPAKSTRAGSCATTNDKAQISQPPPSYGSLRNPITGAPRARKLKLFCNMARRNPLQSLHVHGKLAQGLMTGCKVLSPPFWRSLRNPITGVPRRAETEAFFQHGPPQSFFELSWLALQKARVRKVGARTEDRAQSSQLRNPITGVPRARKLKLFSNMARRNPFELSCLALQKARARSWRNDDRAQISKPPVLALVPQSDHGSAARAETEAFLQYGPPQSFAEPARAREVGARTDDRVQSSQPPLLALAPQSDHGSAAPRGN